MINWFQQKYRGNLLSGWFFLRILKGRFLMNSWVKDSRDDTAVGLDIPEGIGTR